MEHISFCGMDLKDYLIEMEEFHGGRSPGMLVGAVLLDAAMARMTQTEALGVVAETINCLPDAIQLLTPCTVGNGWLRIFNWSKFAITAYDRTTFKGVRAWLVAEAIPDWPAVHQWFNRPDPLKGMPPFDELAESFLAGRHALVDTSEALVLDSKLRDDHPKETGLCPQCRESYPLSWGDRCPACQGMAYYSVTPASAR
jgi:formylmethanofuran dehydrogenase subunit E